jgi:CHAD domain-containing protein
MRVATRRLRAALRLFAPVLPATATTRATSGLAWLGRAVGTVRDLDVLKMAVSKRGRQLEPALQRALRPLHQTIAKRRVVAHADFITVLNSTRYRHLLAQLDALGQPQRASRRAGALGNLAPRLVRPVWDAVLKAGRRLDSDPAAADYHRLRVRVKRLRYTLESLQTIGGKQVRRTIDRLIRLQDLLGAHQDCITQAAWLTTYADSVGLRTATLLATGALMQVLERRARRSRTRATKEWSGFERRALRDKALAEFALPQRGVGSVRLVPAASSNRLARGASVNARHTWRTGRT